MTDQTEWSRWYEHDGTGCPLPVGTYVQINGVGPNVKSITDDWVIDEDDYSIESGWDWTLFGMPVHGEPNTVYGKIIRYRYRVSKAMRDLERLAEQPELEGVA